MESFLFHPVQLDKKMNICYHSETQSPPGDIAYHRGVAQLVARVLWEHDAAGSSPVTPTTGSAGSKITGAGTAFYILTRISLRHDHSTAKQNFLLPLKTYRFNDIMC